jgi:hypothetical protein
MGSLQHCIERMMGVRRSRRLCVCKADAVQTFRTHAHTRQELSTDAFLASPFINGMAYCESTATEVESNGGKTNVTADR